MNKNIFSAIAVMAVILILFASSGAECQKTTVKTNTTALAMNFVENAPPTEMVPRQTYQIYVDVVNTGAADIAAGSANFYLSGFSPDIISGFTEKAQNANFLSGEKDFYEGGKERIVFAEAAQPAELKAKFNSSMKVDACYKYMNSVRSKICVGKTGSICSISGNKLKDGENSAGPVQVTNISEKVEGDKIFITAVIENKLKGSGEVYLSNANCDLLQANNLNEKSKINLVEATVTTGSGFECNLQSLDSSHAPVKGTTGMAYVGSLVCYKTMSADEQMTEIPFTIDMAYVFRQSITKGFAILP